MRLNGKAFDGSTAHLRTDRDFRTIAGNGPRFPEFLPRAAPIKFLMEILLHILNRNHISCHLSGSFVRYIERVFDKYEIIYLYVAKYDAPLLNILFQGGGSADFVELEGFKLELFRPDYVWDTVRYTLTYGDFMAQLTVIGIDSVPCGRESNVDIVRFVWDNGEQFSCTRYSITLLPPHDDPNSRP